MQNELQNPFAPTGLAVKPARLTSIDALRGLIIILMALDHVRDFWSGTPFRPDDIAQTTVPLFLTRWVTHFCAPTFIFLTGISAFLYQNKQPDRKSVSTFLLTRGLWMIFLELAVVGFSWQFNYNLLFLQVIWVIGWSMICLAGLIWLPRWFLISFSILVIAGHQLLVYIEPEKVSADTLGWIFMHRPAMFLTIGNGLPPLFAVYPLLPWVAVMVAGYLIGPWYSETPESRKRKLLFSGAGLLLFFILLRATNLYGDAKPWFVSDRGLIYTVFSFISISKYPPSLLYLSVTLGGACLLLAFFENVRSRILDFFLVFGKVPLFFYLLHIPLINASAMLWMSLKFGYPVNLFFSSQETWPKAYEPNLLRAYLVWGILIFAMYFACRWYGNFKQTHSFWWLKYL
ncbi:DUF1624 domain-containing protein [Dyadobacter sp. NIV53]|uniref:DUF1624 domain-containing protein n=1 Tax=Dyadobacter sp. NIV53 TaxID=2861765 RepID=UPI001C870378|nr:heparan-alpha-glucosaminide N-acetyltransferase domain-containing protein [Dyadobacter sp. NIV53]